MISVVNPRADADVELECVLRGASVRATSARILHDADWNAYNSFEQPDQVVPKPHPGAVDEKNLRMDLPRLSVATISSQLG